MEVLNEKGIVDIIFRYKCGVGYYELKKYIRKEFRNLDDNIIKEITDYVIYNLSKSDYNTKTNSYYVVIHYRTLNAIINGRRINSSLLYYRKFPNYYYLTRKLKKVFNTILEKNNINCSLVLYG